MAPSAKIPGAEAPTLARRCTHFADLVGLGGVEPPTSPLSGVRSNQLSYRPPLDKTRGPRRTTALKGSTN